MVLSSMNWITKHKHNKIQFILSLSCNVRCYYNQYVSILVVINILYYGTEGVHHKAETDNHVNLMFDINVQEASSIK
jgi:hypothetical protein